MPIKPMRFMADSHDRLKEMSQPLRYQTGGELFLVQQGQEPEDFKPMPRVGPGVHEIRLRDQAGIARVFYVAKFPEAVYVLHCFEKKTQKTDNRDIELERFTFRRNHQASQNALVPMRYIGRPFQSERILLWDKSVTRTW